MPTPSASSPPRRQDTPGDAVRRGASRRDQGFTLPEIAISIALMGMLVVPIMSAVTTSIAASARSRSAAQVETAVVNAADRVNRAPKSCAYSEYVRAAVQSQGWPGDRAAVVEERFVPPTVLNQSGTWVPGACEIQTPTDLLVQRITITITSPDGKARRTIQVVKSDV